MSFAKLYNARCRSLHLLQLRHVNMAAANCFQNGVAHRADEMAPCAADSSEAGMRDRERLNVGVGHSVLQLLSEPVGHAVGPGERSIAVKRPLLLHSEHEGEAVVAPGEGTEVFSFDQLACALTASVIHVDKQVREVHIVVGPTVPGTREVKPDVILPVRVLDGSVRLQIQEPDRCESQCAVCGDRVDLRL